LKKLFPSLFLILIILFTLTSCNGVTPPPPPSEHGEIADSHKVTAIAPYYEKLSKENITA
jgi:hypothetical protein